MSLLGRLLAKLRPRAGEPEAGWRVEVSEGALTVHPPGDVRHVTRLADVARIEIRTSDIGPFAADVHWFFFDREGRALAAFPMGSIGEEAAVERLTALPGFDHDAMIRAMTCTDNAVFPVWHAEGAPPRR